MYVDKEPARAMNSGEEKIEDILVLHLEGGKDFFVSLMFMLIERNKNNGNSKQQPQQWQQITKQQ